MAKGTVISMGREVASCNCAECISQPGVVRETVLMSEHFVYVNKTWVYFGSNIKYSFS